MSIGVISRLPFSTTVRCVPCHSFVAGKVLSTQRSNRFSWYSSSSVSPPRASLIAV